MLLKFRRFCTSLWFLPIPLFVGMVGLLGDEKIKIASMLANVFLLTLVLFLSDDLLPALLPAFCVITIGVTLLEDLSVVIPYIPWASPVAVAFVFHLIRYRCRPKLGLSFYGLVITSVAVLLSGIGTELSTRDYTSPAAIYHLIGLSVGLILLYILFACNLPAERDYDPIRYFLAALAVLGLLCAAVVFDNALEWALPKVMDIIFHLPTDPDLLPKEYFADIMYRNTISTLSVMCIPSAFYLAKQSKYFGEHIFFFFIGIVIYLGGILTLARTAMLFGTVLLFLCFVYYFWGRRSWGTKAVNLALLALIGIVLLILLWKPLLSLLEFRLPKGWVSTGESRVALLIRSFEDFSAHPLFGIGITSTNNSDIYSAPLCICWYHLYFPQIWGSMGLLGMITYTVQFVFRAKLVFTKPNAQSIAMGLTYLGLFLYSQTDPGEFAPIPYAVLIIPLFMLLEERRRQVLANQST